VNPTERIRASILEEYSQLISIAQPNVTEYVLESHRNLMNEIESKIQENYQEKMKETVMLLARN
jgi:hypothetical protein